MMGAESGAGQFEASHESRDGLAHEVLGLAEAVALPQDADPRLIDQQHFISTDPASTAHFDGRWFGGTRAQLPPKLTQAAFAHLEAGDPDSIVEEAYVGWEKKNGERWVVNVTYARSGSLVVEVSWQEENGPIHKLDIANDPIAHRALRYARVLAQRFQRGA